MIQWFVRFPWLQTLYAGGMAFLTYLFFYPFRRAYTAASFDDYSWGGIDFKIWMITAQVLGFAVSKGLGRKVVAELLPHQRSWRLIQIAVISWLMYGGFALVPAPYNLVFVFLASLPLGWVYGIMLGFLEGRKSTEILVATLTASFILGSGFAKSVGTWVMEAWGISSTAMPFVASSLVLLPFSLGAWSLGKVPLPTLEDEANRSPRQPMNEVDRKRFIQDFGWALITFVISYVLLTTFREFRDNFLPEIWKVVGTPTDAGIFTRLEVPTAVGVLLLMISLRMISSHIQAFRVIQSLMVLGGLTLIGTTWAYQQGWISPVIWLISLGVGVYVAYAMCNSLYFERLLAAFQRVGTIGFLITLADYYAYLGSILVLFYKHFFHQKMDYLPFFQGMSYGIGALYLTLVLVSWVYLERKYRREVKSIAKNPTY